MGNAFMKDGQLFFSLRLSGGKEVEQSLDIVEA